MTVSDEQARWLYETMVLMQAAPEAPQRKKNVMAGILAGVLSIAVLVGAGWGAWRFLDVSVTPVKTNGVQVLPSASVADGVRVTGDDEIVVPIIPTAPAMAEKVIGEPAPVPTLAPDYAAVIGEQAPHGVRGYSVPNQPTPESALNAVLSSAPAEPTGVAVPVPTISQQQAKIIGAQAPHKVR